MTEIYLIRHTQTEGNRFRMVQGFWDGEVSRQGFRQIEALARRFAEIPVDAVYSSDLTRAMLTAEAAARRDRLPIRTNKALRELNAGPWEQQFFGNVAYEDPALTDRFIYDAENWSLEGAETFQQVRTRALRALEEIARENDGKTVAVVSHGATIRCMLSGITGIPLSDVEHLPIFRNTAVSKLLWDGEKFSIVFLNDDSHVPENLKSSWTVTSDLRDTLFRPQEDRAYYERCYEDAWLFAHGDLQGFSAESYYTAACRHHGKAPGSVLRLWQREEPAGLVDLDPGRGAKDGAGWISLLYLEPLFRGRGYGIQLLARAVHFYRRQGRSCLRLQVAESNRAARDFYAREGFRQTGEQEALTGKLLLLECPLHAVRHLR
ncbi:MAG: GNAT family N-acetyltransferase [Oscillospiraceae bacterium]|nr:GNAT family N-acetyltransferase [Oscillospiraceae bacterium]